MVEKRQAMGGIIWAAHTDLHELGVDRQHCGSAEGRGGPEKLIRALHKGPASAWRRREWWSALALWAMNLWPRLS